MAEVPWGVKFGTFFDSRTGRAGLRADSRARAIDAQVAVSRLLDCARRLSHQTSLSRTDSARARSCTPSTEPYVIEMLSQRALSVRHNARRSAEREESLRQAGARTPTPDRRRLRQEHARGRLAVSEAAARLFGPGGLRLVVWTAMVGLLLSLVFVADAFGWRRPTRIERKAITSVAARVPHAGGSRVHVSGIRVSTVGPWASARLTIDVDGYPDTAVDVLHKVHGTWRNASSGTSGEWCVMPRWDQRNLGFPSSYPCGKQTGN